MGGFSPVFNGEFVMVIDVQQLTWEYMALEKTIEMVAKITAMLRESITLPSVYKYKGDEDDSLPWHVDNGDPGACEYLES